MANEIVPKVNKDTFQNQLTQYLFLDVKDPNTSKILDEFWNAYDTKFKNEPVSVGDMPQLMIGTGIAPTFDTNYKAYIELRKMDNNVTGITSLADFNNARTEYKRIFSLYNLRELGTDENVDKFLLNNVSADEASTRMQTAYDAIKNADPFLRAQLGSLNLEDKDLVKALLLGKEGAIELQDRIKTSNIKAAEQQTGMASVLGAQNLARQGVTRTEAARGLAQTKSQIAGYKAEATAQGQDVTTIQKELEGENLLGMASQRRRKLQQGAVARFSGTSGTTQGSLTRSNSGSI